jgi:hypothetical protein
MKPLAILLSCAAWALSAEDSPQLRAWVFSASSNAAVRSIAPEVHSVRADDDFVYVESAGLSLHSFGPLEANQYDPPLGPRLLTFRIPRHPQPAEGQPMSAPLGTIGVFATGVPIYNPIGTASYRDQNIWHRDAVAASPAGASQLLQSLFANGTRHSPIIGFALDGYPIYGPYGWDAAGNIRLMRSSYRLRSITRRTTLPDGLLLTPSQEGPDAGPEYPLGTFAEDYEFVQGSGDLDESNGRFTRTPEYPGGTYAYFLTGWPYMIGPHYHGVAPFGIPRDSPKAGQPAVLTLAIKDKQGRPIRFLEKVHERPMHLIVVSDDLAEFAHIHPQPAPGDIFTVSHTFAHGGRYTMYADYTAPGSAPTVERIEVDVAGAVPRPEPLCPDTDFTKTAGGVQVTLHLPGKLQAGADLPFQFTLSVNDLEPYLGAWAHIMLVSQDRETFIHAHPLEDAGPAADPLVHVHAVPIAGRSPSTISTVTGFRNPGIYKLWFQFQRQGTVVTVPWVLRVAPADPPTVAAAPGKNAIRVEVSSAGFTPARLVIPANQKTQVAFTRADAQNCAREVVFPELGIRRELPAGRTVVIDLPAVESGEFHFACGMGMYKGVLMVRQAASPE